ncbi:ATP-binding protein [Lishizhenia sp.]|uniref:ATP-binding protein n=1 Tax=Lishizhenia sp. TaxID=2497594 RepID=UPI00299E2F17|nr:ATP-binding protein [Lishizhenia sp.]
MIGRKIKVKSGVAQGFIEKVLTRDITTMASIFDLIDNSIDAAKERMFSNDIGAVEFDEYKMPKNYFGYEISIELHNNYFSVEDNCLGLDEITLTEHAFMVGAESDHEFGLGKFGVGLKRALFKFGTNYSFITDTGTLAFSLDFDNTTLGHTSELEAIEIETSKKPGTRFRVTNLREHVKMEFSSQAWTQKLKNEISARYGIFIGKGFSIKLKVQDSEYEKLESRWPKFHINHPYMPSEKVIKQFQDVSIYIEYGLHTDFKLNAEFGINNAMLKDGNPFGWYVVCNDRVIEIAVREGEDYGWKKAWHNEYNGFVGYIRFHSKSVGSLPWDSTKTRIVTDDLIFLGLKDTLGQMALNYRRLKKFALKSTKEAQLNKESLEATANDSSAGNSSIPPATSNSISNTPKGGMEYTSTSNKRGRNDPEKRQYITHGDYRVPLKNKNMKRVYLELTSLNVEDKTLAVALLARVFLENLYISYYEHRFGNPPSPKLQTHQVMERIITDLQSDETVVFSKDEKRALTALNSIKSNEHSPLSPKTLGANAHLAMYPKARELKIEWDNIDPIVAYFAEKLYG